MAFAAGVGANVGGDIAGTPGAIAGSIIGGVGPVGAIAAGPRVVRGVRQATQRALDGVAPAGFDGIARIFEVPMPGTSSAGNQILVPSVKFVDEFELRIAGGAAESTDDFNRLMDDLRAAFDEEEALRSSGIVRSEIEQGTAIRAETIRTGLTEGQQRGLSGTPLTDFARENVGGNLRQTLPGAVPHTPAQKGRIFDRITDLAQEGEITEFEWLKLTDGLDGSPRHRHPPPDRAERAAERE